MNKVRSFILKALIIGQLSLISCGIVSCDESIINTSTDLGQAICETFNSSTEEQIQQHDKFCNSQFGVVTR